MDFFSVPTLLVLGVIFVNGWTDAPNAIVGCVCSKALSMKKSVVLAAVCNFLGVIISSVLISSVAKNVYGIADISSNAAICAALLSVIVLAVGAWFFGIPTSESHAIIASLVGAAAASGAKISYPLIAVALFGLVISVGAGFALGFYLYSFLKKRVMSEKKTRIYQIVGAGVMAFMHGAQDGQKFIAVLMLASGSSEIGLTTAAAICSVVMALGTSVGGGRIIKNVGENMVSLNRVQGICADIAGGISLAISTVIGLPVSTTHVKTASVMGCGYVDASLQKKTASEMLAAWIITFPACFCMGYLFTKLFIYCGF